MNATFYLFPTEKRKKGINTSDVGYFSTFLKHWEKYYLYKELCVLGQITWSHSTAGTAICADTGMQRLSATSGYRTKKLRCHPAQRGKLSLKPLLPAGARHPWHGGAQPSPGRAGQPRWPARTVCPTAPDPTAGFDRILAPDSAPGSPHLWGFRLAPWWLEWERAEPEAAAGTLPSGRGKFQPRGAALPPLAADSPRPGPSGVRTPAAAGGTAGCVGAGGKEGGAGMGTGSLCVFVRAGARKVPRRFQVSRREVRFWFFFSFLLCFFPLRPRCGSASDRRLAQPVTSAAAPGRHPASAP